MSYISAIGCAVPKYAIKSLEQFEFMQKACQWTDEESRKYKLLYERSGIDKKHTILPDFLKDSEKQLYHSNKEPLIEQRLKIYDQEALSLAVESIKKCLGDKFDYKKITHLITVSCTGMSAPGLDLSVAKYFGMQNNIERTSVNFMGCYAAVHALKSANYICNASENAEVLIVCLELCSLHFQKQNTMDNIASNLLFGDGAAAVLVNNKTSKLKIQSFYSEVNFKGETDMAWNISSHGFLMKLSAYIPELIKTDIKKFVENSCDKAKLELSAIKHWAIHPGGRKILDVIKTSLSLSDDSLSSSYHVLREYGNMSSPTVLFVLEHLSKVKKGNDPVFLSAFGPGLTMESLVII